MINFNDLSKYTPDDLFGFGFKVYQDFGKYTLLLVPSELYDSIPDGTELVDTKCTIVTFKHGVTSAISRFNLLEYGILIKMK